jgi:hypothetical protein
VTEKATGAKSRKLMRDGSVPLEVIFDKEVWNRQLSEDMKPLLKAIIFDARDIVALSAGFEVDLDLEEIDKYVDKQIERFEKVNNSTGEEIASAVLVASSLSGTEEEKSSMLRTGVSAIYSNLLGKRKRLIAEHETQTAFNAGTFFASEKSGSLNKTWLTRRDGSVRTAHQSLDGRTVPVGKGFSVDGNTLRFPGDPSAPLNLTMNCRCRLKFEK